MSTIVSYSKIRQSLKSYLDKACHDSETIIIKRKNGENAVLVSESDYNSMDETAYLLRSAKNRKSLEKNINSKKEKKFHFLSELIE